MLKTKVRVIAVAGGSGSGKTTFARKLQEKLGSARCAILSQDNYYIDQSYKFHGEEVNLSVNFDHPSALDFQFMARQLAELKRGEMVSVPIYDFATHSRLQETEKLLPHEVIIADGTLILTQKELREVCSAIVFIDVAEDVRFARRLKRDVEERGRTPEGVRKQFYEQVKPMHDEFVQSTLRYATHIVRDDASTSSVLAELIYMCE